MPFYRQPRFWVLLGVAVVALLLFDQFYQWEVCRIEVPPGVLTAPVISVRHRNGAAPTNTGMLAAGPHSHPAQTAIGSASGVTLGWNANTEPDLAGYNLYRSASSSGPWGSPINTTGLGDPAKRNLYPY